jgi:predicted PurR-regulated permease PerM
MNQERIVQVFFFGFLALISWELYQVFEPFLMPIAWAILLAFLVHPALIELDQIIHSRTLSALLISPRRVEHFEPRGLAETTGQR